MKKKLLIILFLSAGIMVNAQESFKSNKTKTESYISEVYGTINKNAQLYKNLVDLLSNRVEFQKSPKVQGEKDYPNTSDFPLFNKNNPSLQRDIDINPESFNILKYNLNFYYSTTQIYRFENTDWLLIINPQNKL